MRYRKETITAEKTNIEPITNNQNTLAENLADITRRLQSCAKLIEKTVKNDLLSLATINLKLF